MKAAVSATSRYLPKQIMTNHDLEKMVDTSDDWIQSRTGIVERRVVSEGETTSDMCTHIAYELLKRSETEPDEIDVIMDSGIQRGSHVLKALSLGAKAVGGGRFYLYALAAAGQQGVERALELMKQEIERDMRLMGVSSISELSRNNLRFR